MRTSFRPFCEKEDILRVPGDVLPVCVAGFTSGAGLRVWLRLASPVTADSSSSSSLRVTAADVLSTFMMRAGRGSGRWLLRQIQCLALFLELNTGGSILYFPVVPGCFSVNSRDVLWHVLNIIPFHKTKQNKNLQFRHKAFCSVGVVPENKWACSTILSTDAHSAVV
jgi:hypothetical protein